MSDVFRYGIIGTGQMGFEHILNIDLVEHAEVVAIADPHPGSLEWGIATAGADVTAYADHREMLADTTLDGVVVATPNHTHIEVLRDVLRAPVHVMVEKPLCTTVADCMEVVELAEARPHLVWVGMEYRFMAPVARLIEQCRAGAVGPPVMVAIREHRGPFLQKVGDWNRFAANTGGTLVEKCCHFFDLMVLIMNSYPTRVFASGGQDVNHLDERYDGRVPDILDNAYVTVDFENGSRASLDLCMFADATRNEQEIVVVGPDGKLECAVPESKVWFGDRATKSVSEELVPVEERLLRAGAHHGATYVQHLAFLAAAAGDRGSAISTYDGAVAVAIGAAAEQSVRTGEPVVVADLRRLAGDSRDAPSTTTGTT